MVNFDFELHTLISVKIYMTINNKQSVLRWKYNKACEVLYNLRLFCNAPGSLSRKFHEQDYWGVSRNVSGPAAPIQIHLNKVPSLGQIVSLWAWGIFSPNPEFNDLFLNNDPSSGSEWSSFNVRCFFIWSKGIMSLLLLLIRSFLCFPKITQSSFSSYQ